MENIKNRPTKRYVKINKKEETMTKKDYIMIAKILKEQKASYELVEQLSEIFSKANSKFDYWKFRNACDWTK
jgi:hypothetical protein